MNTRGILTLISPGQARPFLPTMPPPKPSDNHLIGHTGGQITTMTNMLTILTRASWLGLMALAISSCSNPSPKPGNLPKPTLEEPDNTAEAAPVVNGEPGQPADTAPCAASVQPKDSVSAEVAPPAPDAIVALCHEIGAKLGSVSTEDCLAAGLRPSSAESRQARALATVDFASSAAPRVLLMGGIHGDEYSSVSIVFRWLEQLRSDTSPYHWRVIPLLNPDGLLRNQSQRQNQVGVDLNRNFPSPDWAELAHSYWRNRTGSNPRRFPGPTAASEPETQWFIAQIESFKPDAIVAVHAPHSLVDFDGPTQPPTQLGELQLRRLGVYPGSLGNYAGVHLGIPVVTVELSSAGVMPSPNQISDMWKDLQDWLYTEIKKAPSGASNKTGSTATE